jgi:hypothetical protein
MRHLLSAVVMLLLLAAGVWAVDAVAARGKGPVVAWVWLRDADSLKHVLAAGDARVLDLRAGGRLVQLYVSSPRAAGWPARGTWATLRFAPGLAWPGCG